MSDCSIKCPFVTGDNKYDVLIRQLEREIAEIEKTDVANSLRYENKLNELCCHIKNNLSNELRLLFDSMKVTGELDNLITEIVLHDVKAHSLKLEGFVSVKEFGAQGNGMCDDTKAIQEAINSGASTIYFPSGTYMTNSLQIKSDIALVGCGDTSVLKHLAIARNDLITHDAFEKYADNVRRDSDEGCIKNVEIANIKIIGSYVKGLNAVSIYGYNLAIHDVEISNFNGKGLWLESAGAIHSTAEQNLQNDIYNLTVSHCKGGNIYYNGQSDSIFTNVLCYYGGENEGYENTVNVYLGTKATGCKFNGAHFWGECLTHLVVDSEGNTFTNLHSEGAFTQIEINNRFTTMSAEIYDPIHKKGGTTGVKFGQMAGNFLGNISCRNIETVFDYQGFTPYGHNINAHVSQNIDGILFTNYPSAPFINCQWYANGEYKWVTVTPWSTIKENWANFNFKTPPTFDVNNERVFGTINNGSPTSYINIENGNTARGSRISVNGTEENADLQLSAKGGGKVRFGDYTAGSGTVNGYIEIKDSNGTIRKLACI